MMKAVRHLATLICVLAVALSAEAQTQTVLDGAYVKSVKVGDTFVADSRNTFFTTMSQQVEYFAKEVHFQTNWHLGNRRSFRHWEARVTHCKYPQRYRD